ncbi:ribonuclease H-like domain-containing protein [Tanacetum coccineum]
MPIQLNSSSSSSSTLSDLNDIHVNESEVLDNVFDSVFDSRESNGDHNQVNDRFKKGEGYHAVPPPYIGNYMPPRADLSFAGLDDSVFKFKVSETITSVPKTVGSSAPLIEEWESDSEDKNVFKPKEVKITVKPSFEKIEFVNARNTTVEKPMKFSQSPRGNKRNWNGLMTQRLGDSFEFKKKTCFVCGSLNHLIKDCDFYKNKMVEKSVLNNKGKITGPMEIRPVWDNTERSGQVPVNAAKQISHGAAVSVSAVRRVNTAAPRPNVNDALPTTYSYFKAHSPDQGIFDSRCSRYMTGNKSYLIDYQEIDGGFVAFGGNAKGGKITRKGKIRTGKLDFEDVYFVKELKFNLFSVSQMCDQKNSILFIDTEYVVLSPDFKLLDESQDETPEILKNFKTGIENQIDHKVKTIRCDNGTEFKNRIMNEFCEMKGIMREFSVARTPQQNGRKPTLSFMRPFGCHVTILNTLDHLGNQTNGNAGPKSSEDEVADDAGKKNGVLDPAKEGDKNGQEKDVRDQEEAFRKQFEQGSERLFGQGEATNTNNTNRLNIVSSSINAVSSSFTTVDPGRERAQRNGVQSVAVGSSYDNLNGSIPVNVATLPSVDLPTDPLMLDLEDTADLQVTGIFNGAYDDEVESAGADFNNLNSPQLIEAIGLFFAYASFMGFIVYQMDVKSAFLYGVIEKEVLLETWPKYNLVSNRSNVDDIIFGSTKKSLCTEFEVKTASTPIETNKALLKDEEVED